MASTRSFRFAERTLSIAIFVLFANRYVTYFITQFDKDFNVVWDSLKDI